MVEGANGLYGRTFLEDLLGGGRFAFRDQSTQGRKEFLHFKCGCKAQRGAEKLFDLFPCRVHAHLTHAVREEKKPGR